MTEPEPINNQTSSDGKTLRRLKSLAPWLVSLGLVGFVAATNDLNAVARAFGQVEWVVFAAVTVPFLVALLFLESWFLLAGFRWFAGAGTFSDLIRARAARVAPESLFKKGGEIPCKLLLYHRLVNEYGLSMTRVGELFGVSVFAVSKGLKRLAPLLEKDPRPLSILKEMSNVQI